MGKDLPFWEEWAANPNYNSFWERQDWPRRAESIDVPALIISGWCDDNFTGSLEAWAVMNRPGKAPARMILGPWPHDLNTTRDLHGAAYGNDSLYYNIDLLHLQWFDRFLKGKANGWKSPGWSTMCWAPTAGRRPLTGRRLRLLPLPSILPGGRLSP